MKLNGENARSVRSLLAAVVCCVVLWLTLDAVSTVVVGFEAPISEGGTWMNGGKDGLDWADVHRIQGRASGTQSEFGPRYADSAALLKGSWGPNQTVEATVHTRHQSAAIIEEVELRLRSTISAHFSTGYEVTFRCLRGSGSYTGIARWNGALGDFTSLAFSSGSRYGIKEGDAIRAMVVGNRISGFINGIEVVHASDAIYASGAPGMGFYLEGGTAELQADFGFWSLRATDGKRIYSTRFGF
jgi:hypothetical protein